MAEKGSSDVRTEPPVPLAPEALAGEAGDGARPAGPPPEAPSDAPHPAPKRPAFVFAPLAPYKGMVRRFFILYKHVFGLLFGGAVAYVRALPPERRRWLRSPGPRSIAFLARPFLNRDLVRQPFPVQLRRRLEILGPTYVKLGQILAIREDLLPESVTRELTNLLDRLPAIPFPQVQALIEASLERPLEALFRRIDTEPLGSASIAQVHRAETLEGDDVVVKVMKPGIRDVITSDLRLLRLAGHFLQWIIPQYEPRRVVEEFSAYTEREVDFRYEADNAETFAANFHDLPDIVFPKMYRHLSTGDVLTMAYVGGFKPGSPPTYDLSDEQRERVLDLGAAAIIRMLYRDGFFHADLHAGNLLVLPGERIRLGFIDLGMVGRFEERTRRRMLYYFHALVTGDVEGATRHLIAMATVGRGGDLHGFRRAVSDLSRRFLMHAQHGDFSIAQLILESLSLGGRHRVSFPVEMTLMVKALVTFEGVGRMLNAELDIPEYARRHVTRTFREHFDPQSITRQLLRGAPEMVDLAIQLPQLLTTGARVAEEALQDRTADNPLAGLRSSIFAGACIVGAALVFVQGGALLFWIPLLVFGLLLYLFGKK